jgi:hypothetical protein
LVFEEPFGFGFFILFDDLLPLADSFFDDAVLLILLMLHILLVGEGVDIELVGGCGVNG